MKLLIGILRFQHVKTEQLMIFIDSTENCTFFFLHSEWWHPFFIPISLICIKINLQIKSRNPVKYFPNVFGLAALVFLCVI